MKRRPARWLVLLLCCLTLLTGCSEGSGDRVLVAKYYYDSGIANPDRFDVVVFRCPEEPRVPGPLQNYIKRLIGLFGETIGIFFGRLFTFDGMNYEKQDAGVKAVDLWKKEYTHANDPMAQEFFQQGRFQIIRKKPAVMLALQRVVYDHDFPPKDTPGIIPPRWQPGEGGLWATAGESGFQNTGKGQGEDWLRYQHILRPDDWPTDSDPMKGPIIESIKQRQHKARLITDFSGYNSYLMQGGAWRTQQGNWVGDLLLEGEVQVEQAQGEFWMELAKGVDRFQARWDLQSGVCSLVRFRNGGREETLSSTVTTVKGPGTYRLRFANVDERLTVWVGGELPFQDGVAYERAWSYDKNRREFVNTGPTANDLKPASLASKGAAVSVRHLKLWRDTYYTGLRPGGLDIAATDAELPRVDELPEAKRDNRVERAAHEAMFWADFWGDSGKWSPLRRLPTSTMYVQPGHYLCLGDNSPESSDSRSWGAVPQRLLLGRAVGVYWPATRLGVIK